MHTFMLPENGHFAMQISFRETSWGRTKLATVSEVPFYRYADL